MTDRNQRDLSTLLDVLACPDCRRHPLFQAADAIGCSACGRMYEMVDGIPILLIEATSVTVKDDHDDEHWGSEVVDWPSPLDDPVLKIGASGQPAPRGWIQVDSHVLETTDLVADVHRLPFRDATFATILSFHG